jgi:hypothetical protein
MNAKTELLKHIKKREVEYIDIVYYPSYSEKEDKKITGTLDEVIELLDFDYDDGYGKQYIVGTIWFKDGTWSTRGEYDGSEWWEHHERPNLPNARGEQ